MASHIPGSLTIAHIGAMVEAFLLYSYPISYIRVDQVWKINSNGKEISIIPIPKVDDLVYWARCVDDSIGNSSHSHLM